MEHIGVIDDPGEARGRSSCASHLRTPSEILSDLRDRRQARVWMALSGNDGAEPEY